MKGESLEKLYARQAFARACVKMVQDELAGENPDVRAPDALKRYTEQLASIDAEITVILEARDGKPPDVVVGLKSASLSGIVPK